MRRTVWSAALILDRAGKSHEMEIRRGEVCLLNILQHDLVVLMTEPIEADENVVAVPGVDDMRAGQEIGRLNQPYQGNRILKQRIFAEQQGVRAEYFISRSKELSAGLRHTARSPTPHAGVALDGSSGTKVRYERKLSDRRWTIAAARSNRRRESVAP